MLRKYLLLGFIVMCCASAVAVPLEDAIYSDEYYLSIYPSYPPFISEKINLRLRTFKPAQKVTIYSDRSQEIPMVYREGYWWGKFQIPADYQEGSHFFYVWIRYPFAHQIREEKSWINNIFSFFGFKKKILPATWARSLIWYKTQKNGTSLEADWNEMDFPEEIGYEEESRQPVLVVTGEAVEIKAAPVEAIPFVIKGTKTLSFVSRSIEGTKEGYIPGVSREEALRLNISGKSDDIEVDANLISTSTAGTAQVSQREEKVSLLLRKGSSEAYLGDFTADFTETEFAALNKVMSGVRFKGDYEKWGVNALYSSPKGASKFKRLYGDGTQGPFKLDFTPVVIDSERVYLDSNLQKRGDDYTIDYQAGTVTFLKKMIDPKSILNFYYDYRQSVYRHSTYGLRLTGRPYPNLKLGTTYLNDSDSLAGAEEIRKSMTGDPVDPQGHYVVGVDGNYVSESLTANSEFAYSNKNLNLLSSSASEEIGTAAKLELSTQLGPWGIGLRGERVGAKFFPLAEPDPKQDVTAYGGKLSFRPGALFGAQGSWDQEKYTQSAVIYENQFKSAKAFLTPESLPSLEYNHFESEQSNDPVTGSKVERAIIRDSAESTYRLGLISTSLKGTQERWLDRFPSEEVTNCRKVNFGLATAGIEVISLSSNVELENREEPSGATPYRKTYNINLSATPGKQYFVSGAVEYLEDSEQGIKNVADIAYRAQPHEMFKTESKYTITSLNEDYATTEVVSKQTGSFSFELKPTRLLRARYLYKPNFTKILRTNTVSFNNEQQQAELNLIPAREIMLGMLYKLGRSYNVLKQDYRIRENSADSDSILYTLKMAPFEILSTEFGYQIENGKTTSLATSEPASYTPGKSYGKKFDAMVKTSLSEKLSVDTHYAYQLNTQGSGDAASNVIDTVSYTGSLKGLWNISDLWSVSLSGTYSKMINNLVADPVTYTVSPGFGVIYRQGNRLRIDLDYTYSKSYAGSTTEKTNYSLRAKYSLSDYVNLSLCYDQEISHAPDYKLTDIAGNVEINL
jgi:hypothetical protein